MLKSHFLALVIGLFLSFQSSAKILVVSDIDDTLKIAHILDLYSMVDNSIAYDNHFLGMDDLYRRLQASERVDFAYVSNSVSWVMAIPHEAFLTYNEYPAGPMLLRQSMSDQNHKWKTITALVEQTKPEMLILIGDNGERDTLIYKSVTERYPQLPVKTFIHQVYSQLSEVERGKALEAGQKGFATSIDLAGELRDLGVIKEADFGQMVEKLVPRILKQNMDAYLGEMAFPNWMDCRDFLLQKQRAVLASQGLSKGQSDLITRYEEVLKARCSRAL